MNLKYFILFLLLLSSSLSAEDKIVHDIPLFIIKNGKYGFNCAKKITNKCTLYNLTRYHEGDRIHYALRLNLTESHINTLHEFAFNDYIPSFNFLKKTTRFCNFVTNPCWITPLMNYSIRHWGELGYALTPFTFFSDLIILPFTGSTWLMGHTLQSFRNDFLRSKVTRFIKRSIKGKKHKYLELKSNTGVIFLTEIINGIISMEHFGDEENH